MLYLIQAIDLQFCVDLDKAFINFFTQLGLNSNRTIWGICVTNRLIGHLRPLHISYYKFSKNKFFNYSANKQSLQLRRNLLANIFIKKYFITKESLYSALKIFVCTRMFINPICCSHNKLIAEFPSYMYTLNETKEARIRYFLNIKFILRYIIKVCLQVCWNMPNIHALVFILKVKHILCVNNTIKSALKSWA